MDIFGNYQVEAEISFAAHVRVYRARRTDKQGGDAVCLKVWDIPEPGAYSIDMGRLFTEASKIQADLARKHPRTWVPVLDQGISPDGYYVVTPLYPDTVANRLGTVSADSVLLKFVVSRVVAALEDLENHSARDHGNLKPSKLLMEGSGPITRRKLRVNEPAPAELVDRTVYRKPDMRSLGELIFMLASRVPAVNANMRSVPAHTEWPKLGSEEQAWKNLCSDLLDPNGRFQQAGLADLRRELDRLGRVKSHSGRWVLLAAGLLLAAAGGGTWYWYATRPPKIDISITEQYVGYCVAYEDWLREFARQVRRRRSEIAADPYLSKTLAGVLEKRGEKLVPGEAFRMLLPADPTEVPQELALDTGLQRRVTEAYIFLLEVNKALEGWPVRQRALELAGQFRQSGLEGAALQIEQLAGQYRQDDGLFDQLLVIRKLVPDVETVLAAVNRLKESHAVLAAIDDPLLGQLPQWQMARLQESGKELESVFQTVDELSRELRPVQDIVEQPAWRRQYDYDLFRGELLARQPVCDSVDDISEWIRLLGEFRRVADPRTAEFPALNGMLRQIESQVARLPQFDLVEQQRAFSAELNTLQAGLADAGQIPAIERELGRINESIGSLRTAVSDLNRRVSELISRYEIDPVEWLEKWRREPIPVGGVFAEVWTSRRDAVLARETVASLKAEQSRAYSLERLLNHFRDLLTGIDRSLPAASLSGTVRSAEMDLRLEPYLIQSRVATARRILEQLPAAADSEGLELDAFLQREAVARPLADYRETLESASAFTAAFARFSRELVAQQPPGEEFYAFIEREIQSASGWIARLQVQAAELPSLAAMLEAGQLRTATDAARLLALIGSPEKVPAVRWTAWRRLDSLGVVPGNPQQWQEWVDVYRPFAGALPDALKPALNGPAFWARAAAKAADLPTLQAAFSCQSVFGGLLESLPDTQRFIHFLLEQRSRVDADRSIFSASGKPVADWRQAIVGRMESDFAATDVPAIRAFLEAVKRLDPDAEGERIDPALLGPGPLAGWKTSADAASGRVTYRWAGFDIPFMPVDVGSGDLYYLSTVELPVGLVIQWFYDHPDQWEQVVQGAQLPLAGAADRHGPSTWAADDQGRPDYVMQWQNVSPRWELQQYAAQLPEPRPGDEHPIQFVSPKLARAIARAFNCELPSPAIYAALLAPAVVQQPIWNRRDLTWSRQRAHVAQANARMLTSDPPWPDLNIFLPEGLAVQQGEGAVPAVAYDDQQLWFDEVSVTRDAPAFPHLVGNVAEFAFDPETGAYFVIGSSALSPPEVQPDVPYPVPAENLSQGYSDVGLRLAFALPRNTPGAQLARTILDPRYLEALFNPQ